MTSGDPDTAEEERVRRYIYASRARHDFLADELVGLLSVARDRNAADGLTGMLLYCGQSFLQALEGDAAAVARTAARIAADPRHEDLRVLLDAEVGTRLFPDWTMGFDHVDDEWLAETLPGYTAATTYPLMNPSLVVNGTVAETLLALFAKNRRQPA
jgi:hypothetical protein